jgi:hypothetical protein
MKSKGPGGQDAIIKYVERDGATFAVSWYDIPGAAKEAAAKLAHVLDDVAESAARAMPGTKVTEKTRIALHDKYVGLAAKLDAPNTETLARFYIANGRLFQIMVSGKHGTVNRSDAEAFFRSFEVIEP